jgi:hypothetical protein
MNYSFVKGQRYLFQYVNTGKYFRADFTEMRSNPNVTTLILDNYQRVGIDERMDQRWCIDAALISKVETLVDLTDGTNCPLPTDILLHLDNYY